MDFEKLIIEAAKYLSSAIICSIIVGYIVFTNPDKVQQWLSLFWKIVSIFWHAAGKKVIKHDIEGRINEFSKYMTEEIPGIDVTGIQIQWIEEGETADQFFKDNKLIIRMQNHRDQNKNFVNASMIFISQFVIPKAKKYISKSQRESIDLFIAKRLFEKEKPSVVARFFEDFMSPLVNTHEKVAELVEKYHIIDKAGIFFPVLIQELTFLGDKVFFRKKSDQITQEVSKLIDFLTTYSRREIGDESIPNIFQGQYCRCSIMIAAKAEKRACNLVNGYVRYIQELSEKKIENIYLIGPSKAENMSFLENICSQVNLNGKYERYLDKTYTCKIYKRGEAITVRSHLVLFRAPSATMYFDEEYQRRFLDPNQPEESIITEKERVVI